MDIKRYVGDKAFYKNVMAITIPMMIQNGISNFVNLLDNVMVGQLNTEAMSAVSIVNNIVFIFFILVFGAIAGAGIFTAQYYGNNDDEGIRYTFRFKLIAAALVTLIGMLVFAFFKGDLISLFLHDSDSGGDLALTFDYANEYFVYIMIGLVPNALSQVYAATLRETAKTTPPMAASVAAIFTNLALNYILIFGHFGAPAMGVKGAAIATTISRFVEIGILIVWTHSHKKKCAYMKGVYSSLYVPVKLVKGIIVKGLPLLVNEFLWSIGVTFLTQSYSTRGLDAVAALNISTTISGLFNVVYLTLGSAVSIIVGSLLGAGKADEAKDTNRKLLVFSVFCSTCIGVVLAVAAYFIPMIYNTTPDVRHIATMMLLTLAVMMPFHAYTHAAYFTLRSGGKVFITLLLDSGYTWVVAIPIAFVLSRFTGIGIISLYAICQGADLIKCFFSTFLLKKVDWANKLIGDK